MAYIALALSVLTAAVGVLGLFSPDALLGVIRSLLNPAGLYFSAAIRIVFGAALFLAAPRSRAPEALRILGIVFVAAGLLIPVIGLEGFRGIIDWWSDLGPALHRIWGVIAISVGLVLAYLVFPQSHGAEQADEAKVE